MAAERIANFKARSLAQVHLLEPQSLVSNWREGVKNVDSLWAQDCLSFLAFTFECSLPRAVGLAG